MAASIAVIETSNELFGAALVKIHPNEFGSFDSFY